ncbi:hypothetical protein NQ318_001686 [Aromia moschata]|uniref:Uncharacterized protein n=1 Tax=Aromia moschata TaxID=1265417 RepID=A0AAV8X5N5_9CUCU|nr:hypothetical protein NQ318_001686 [Aromia moschata]
MSYLSNSLFLGNLHANVFISPVFRDTRRLCNQTLGILQESNNKIYCQIYVTQPTTRTR